MSSVQTRVKLFGTYLLFIGLLGGVGMSRFSQSEQNQPQRLMEVLETIQQVASGEKLLAQTMKVWKIKNLSETATHLKLDKVSRTDTVLTRHYNPRTHEETREREVTIYLKESQSQLELILDLVHELVHATARPVFDPYDPSLTAGKYAWLAIEGEGGEVDAVVTECQLAMELSKRFDWSTTRCERYIDEDGRLFSQEDLRNAVKRDFYKVGKTFETLVGQLGKDKSLFPLLSADSPRFFSSTGQAPYPVSLYREFEEITETACQNSRNRAKSLSLSSIQQDPFILKRCQQGS